PDLPQPQVVGAFAFAGRCRGRRAGFDARRKARRDRDQARRATGGYPATVHAGAARTGAGSRMSSGPPSGGGGQAPPPEVQAELQALFEAQLDMIGRLVPGLPPAAVQQAYHVASVQEEQLSEVWMDLAEGPKP